MGKYINFVALLPLFLQLLFDLKIILKIDKEKELFRNTKKLLNSGPVILMFIFSFLFVFVACSQIVYLIEDRGESFSALGVIGFNIGYLLVKYFYKRSERSIKNDEGYEIFKKYFGYSFGGLIGVVFASFVHIVFSPSM